jgi:parvulin-like peptidyl-prolyl isomerase
MKFLTRLAMPVLLLFASLCFPQSELKAPGAMFPAVVAKVNGAAIPGRDLEGLVRGELGAIGNPDWNSLRGEYRAELVLTNLTTLVNAKLIFLNASSAGIKAADADVLAEVQKIIKTFKNEAEMKKALNMDRAALEKSMFERLTVSRYLDVMIKNKIAFTPEELTKLYSSNPEDLAHPDIVRIRQILIKADGKAQEQDAAAKKRAEALLARVRNGESFAKLAQENSMDSSASRGGDLGYISKEGLPPEFANAAFSSPIGKSSLVKTQDGYYIIKVDGRKKAGRFTFEEIKPKLIERLKNIKYQKEFEKLISQLRDAANIEILISAGELLKS